MSSEGVISVTAGFVNPELFILSACLHLIAFVPIVSIIFQIPLEPSTLFHNGDVSPISPLAVLTMPDETPASIITVICIYFQFDISGIDIVLPTVSALADPNSRFGILLYSTTQNS